MYIRAGTAVYNFVLNCILLFTSNNIFVSIKKECKPAEEAPGTASSEPEIISESFFLLTSSSFSNDLSRGLMPTDYNRVNNMMLKTSTAKAHSQARKQM